MNLEILTAACRNPAVTGKCAMGVMVKTPRKGFSKTRLSPPLSSEEAASISRCFLKDTSMAIQALCQEDPFVVGLAIYTPVGSEATLGEFLPAGFKMIAQREGDFGTRLLGAAEDLFSVGFSAVCLIDSDSPTLPFHCLRDLTTLLKEPKDRMVIGPCSDGGYYLLGLRHPHTRLFEDVTWNTDRVYVETVERSKELSFGEAATDPPKPGKRPAMGKAGDTGVSGKGGMASATVTRPPSAGFPRPKQKRSGGALGSTAALTR